MPYTELELTGCVCTARGRLAVFGVTGGKRLLKTLAHHLQHLAFGRGRRYILIKQPFQWDTTLASRMPLAERGIAFLTFLYEMSRARAIEWRKENFPRNPTFCGGQNVCRTIH